ncbi:18870_t:CDS:2 [Racocetra fulgida]|uniref:18870_t:CDS:1 n=1 Tax=Racocetra fulgida TaxID=60492 RepID=A0A9N8Z0J0_9GLOM|nr:18870_t:CDS:2 [Racocetra fulgida]
MEDYYDYSTDEDLGESFSTNQDEPLFVHDYLAAMKARDVEENKQSPCVLIDNFKGEIRRCNSTHQLRSISQLVGTWENQKKEVLWHMMKLLENPESNTPFSKDTMDCLPSPLLVKIAMKIKLFKNYLPTDKKYIKEDEYRQHGEALGNFICNSRKDIEQHRNKGLGKYEDV